MKRTLIWAVAVFSFGVMSACDADRPAATDTQTVQQPPMESPQTQAPESESMAAQDADAEQLELVVENLQYNQNELRVSPGQRIQVILTNKGEVETSLRFELPGTGQELRTPVPPGQRAAIIFTAPEKKGVYPFFSPLRNQRDRGLTGQLVVE
jgi:FtsP/CotA-like multicopper oxidase with cupredoxin domain